MNEKKSEKKAIYEGLSDNQIHRMEAFMEDLRPIFIEFPGVLREVNKFLIIFENQEKIKEASYIIAGTEYPLIEYELSIIARRKKKKPFSEILQKVAESEL